MKKITLLLAVLLTVCMLFNGCKKDKDPTNDNKETPLEVWSNVNVIDSTQMVLDERASDLEAGKFVFNSLGSTQFLEAGDVMVGSTGEGYIRKIVSVSVSGSTVTYGTVQASLNEVFKNGDLSFSLDMNGMNAGGRSAGFSPSVSNVNIYKKGPLSIDLISGSLSMNSDWFFDLKFDSIRKETSFFELSTKGSGYSADAQIKVTASGSVEDSETDTLHTYEKVFTKDIPAVILGVPVVIPVKVKMHVRWLAESSVKIDAKIQHTTKVSTNGNLTLGMRYANKEWAGLYEFNPTTTVESGDVEGNASSVVTIGLRPVISFKLYGVAGPYASVGLMTDIKGRVASPSLDWDAKASAWAEAHAGAEVTIFGESLAKYTSPAWTTDKLIHSIPERMERTSGDNQKGKANEALAQPCKVKVMDTFGKPVKGVPVYFKVTSGGGKVNPTSILSDKDGYAETSWTLGDVIEIQYMEASVKDGSQQLIKGAPVEFAAIAEESEYITDPRDGEKYKIVKIGTQTWFAENLRYSGSIPNVTSDAAWEAIWNNGNPTGQPAWAYYDNNAGYHATYGKLYNWYAVNTGTLCPPGWHIPSDAEWTVLTDYLGGASVAGIKMKSTTGWNTGGNGDNSSGFTGLPGGTRLDIGTFSSIGNHGYWWSSTERNTLNAWYRYLNYGLSNVYRYNSLKENGFSCRCLRD